jgi:hypothetical protein
MIIGAHVIVYSKDADADRAFLRDILQLGSVDVGGGWLIFGLPPSEVAVHPSVNNDLHELYLMCEDVVAFIREMLAHDIPCSPVDDQGWGLLTSLTLPGGGKLGVYQPRHERPAQATVKLAKKKARSASGKVPAKKPGKTPAKKPGKLPSKKPGKTLAKGSATAKKKATKRKATGRRRPGAR